MAALVWQQPQQRRNLMAKEYPCPNENCDMVYLIEQVHCPTRDKDKIVCDKCGTEIISWNGGVMYMEKGTTTKKP